MGILLFNPREKNREAPQVQQQQSRHGSELCTNADMSRIASFGYDDYYEIIATIRLSLSGRAGKLEKKAHWRKLKE